MTNQAKNRKSGLGDLPQIPDGLRDHFTTYSDGFMSAELEAQADRAMQEFYRQARAQRDAKLIADGGAIDRADD